MATQAEKIAAAEKALLDFDGTTDKAEAARAVALVDSQLALLPVPAPAPAPEPRPELASAALIGFNRPVADPDLEARIKANEAETIALARIMLDRAEPPGS